MANLMNMRELGQLRNATQQMDRGGGVYIPDWRKRRQEQQTTPGSAVGMPPTGRDMVAAQASAPLYVTDEGEEVYLQDVVDVGGMGRLRAISKAPKAIQQAFFKWVNRNKAARHRAGKPPMDAEARAQLARKAGVATGVAAGAGGAGKYLSDEGLIPTLEHQGEGRLAWNTGGGDAETAPPPPPLAEVATETTEARTSGAWSPAAGTTALPPQLQPIGPTVVEEEVVEEVKSTVGGRDISEAPPEKKQELERVWGKYTYSPKERHNKFMEQLNSIYMKAAWLDVIASITGGTSQSAQYISRATGKLEMMAKFDQEERVYNIWRDVYHDENGNYDPPKSKKEAAERARRLGASPEETQKIYGWSEEQDDLVSWWRPADNEKKYEVKTTHGKKESPARGTGADWIMGSPPTSLTAPTAKPPPGYITWTDGKTNTPVLKGQLGPAGFWVGTAGSSSGTYNERVESKAAEFLKAGQEPRAIAAYENYYRSAKDQFGNLAFPDSLGAKQAAIEAVNNLKIQLYGLTEDDGADIPIVSGQPKTKEEAYIMARGDPQNSKLSNEEVKADVEAYWIKRMGQSQ